MKTLRVRDIMTTDVQTLTKDTKVADAARILTERRVSGGPVLDAGRIVGVVSKSDLVDPRSGLAEGGSRTIADVMTYLIITVRPNDPVMIAVRLMIDAGIHRVVVTDEDGKLAGIISPTDVLRALDRGERINEEEKAAPLAPVVDLRTIEIRI